MQISDAEWQVNENYLDARRADQYGLIRVLAERFDWSKSTIQTLLARLVEKECLTRKKEGKSFVLFSTFDFGPKSGIYLSKISRTRFVLVGLRTCWLI